MLRWLTANLHVAMPTSELSPSAVLSADLFAHALQRDPDGSRGDVRSLAQRISRDIDRFLLSLVEGREADNLGKVESGLHGLVSCAHAVGDKRLSAHCYEARYEATLVLRHRRQEVLEHGAPLDRRIPMVLRPAINEIVVQFGLIQEALVHLSVEVLEGGGDQVSDPATTG